MNLKRKLSAIMLVDDEPADNYFHRRILQKAEVTEEIIVKENGEEAMGYLSSLAEGHLLRPELIFLDINMPLMDGWAFLDAYRELPISQRANMVIVMLTTSPDPQDEAKASEMADVMGLRNKPLTEEMLAEILRRYFPNHV